MSSVVKFGIIGLGNMGLPHLTYMKDMPGVEVAAVCDIIRSRADAGAALSGAKAFYDHETMLAEAGLDAVIIATPHYDHTPISEHCFERGLHVLCEKPLSVHVNDARRTLRAYEEAKAKNPDLVFGIMFQERTNAPYRKVKDVIDGGELGKLMRVTWINTQWFRSQCYYDSGGWRATWGGEGGGILTNQCPHNLDMYQWLFGMPAKISGHAALGKYHRIEVEDEVTAYFEHENGMIGHFIVNTAELPGTNRLEVIGENGKLVLEDGQIVFHRNRQSGLTFLREVTSPFGVVESWRTEIPVPANLPNTHQAVTEKFIAAIRNKKPLDLYAHGSEGLNGVTLANGIMLSAHLNHPVDVPFDADQYEALLRERIKTSTFVKPEVDENAAPAADMAASFTK